MDNLLKAKSAIIMESPFFASLLCSMPLVEDNSIKTLSTDGERIKFNRDFVAPLKHDETKFVLAHEVMHCVLGHIFRREGRESNRWNIAADYVVNELLAQEKIGNPIKGALRNSGLVKAGNGTAEGVYKLLADQQQQNQSGKPQSGNQQGQPQQGKGKPGQPDPNAAPAPGEEGGAMDSIEDAAIDQAGMAQKEAEMRVKLVKAANAAKMAGQLSGGMARIVEEAVKQKVCWKEVLRQFLSARAKTELTYAKPNRRSICDDVILPSRTGEQAGVIAIAVDCSGSVDDEQLKQFGAEIKAIVEDIHPLETRVIYFDSKICHVDTFGPDEEVTLNSHGGGGTAFSPVFEYIDEEAVDPMACVFLTDLDCTDFGDAPAYPVLWATTRKEKAPFGEIVRMK